MTMVEPLHSLKVVASSKRIRENDCGRFYQRYWISISIV